MCPGGAGGLLGSPGVDPPAARAACRSRRGGVSSASTSNGTRRSSNATSLGSSVSTMPYSAQCATRISLRPPLAERLADAARVDDQRRPEAAQHLQVRVAVRRARSRRAGEHPLELVVGRRREDPVGERAAASRGSRACACRRRAEPRGSAGRCATNARSSSVEELGPPGADLVEHDSHRVVGGREAARSTSCPSCPRITGQPSSRTRSRHSCACGPKQMSPRQTTRSSSCALEVGEHRVERGQVPVDVGDQGDPRRRATPRGFLQRDAPVAAARRSCAAFELRGALYPCRAMSFMRNHPGTSSRSARPSAPYRLEELLGEGGMGLVFRAVRESDGEVVALKVMRFELIEDPVFGRRFEQEARAAAEVTEPHLVPVLEAGQAEGRRFLASKFIDGATLEDLLDDGPLALARHRQVDAGRRRRSARAARGGDRPPRPEAVEHHRRRPRGRRC